MDTAPDLKPRTRRVTSTTPPTAPLLPAELDALLRRMRLPYLRAAAPDVIATAKAQRWDPAEVLRVLMAEEVLGRDNATRRTRRKAAAFPAGKTFATWRPDESSIEPATQHALATLDWISRAQNLAVAGPSGTGKSHFVDLAQVGILHPDLVVGVARAAHGDHAHRIELHPANGRDGEFAECHHRDVL